MQSASLPRGAQPFRLYRDRTMHRTAQLSDTARLSDHTVGPGPGSIGQQAASAVVQSRPPGRNRRGRTALYAAARPYAAIRPPTSPPRTTASSSASSSPTPAESTSMDALRTSASAAIITTWNSSRNDRSPSIIPNGTSSSGSGNNSSTWFMANATAGSRDLRLDLWLSLLQASAEQLATATASAAAAANGLAVRLQRMSQPPPPSFPAGPSGDQTLSLLSDPLTFLTETTAQYGSLVGLMVGGERVVLVTGREEARAVLVEQAGSVYVKEGTAFFPGSSLAGNGLLVSDGAVWQRQRRLSNPAFRRVAVEAYASAMVAATTDLMDSEWGAGGTRDVYEDFNELTLCVTLEALFGYGVKERTLRQTTAAAAAAAAHPVGPTPSSTSAYSSSGNSSEEAQQIVAAVEKAFMFFTQRAATGFVIPEWLPTWDNLEFAAAVQQLDRVVYGMIERRREEVAAAHGSVDVAVSAAAAGRAGGDVAGSANPATVPSDLLTSLLLSRDEDGSGMTDQALRDELMTLLVAGQETSAILLGWAAALLAAHPEVQARAAAEVEAVCGRHDPPAPASVRRMPYLESIVLETLRLYSPAYMVGRCAAVEAALGPYTLPAGTTVLVSPYVMHRDPSAWDEPNAFRPERWQDIQNREGYQGYMSLMSNLGPNGAYLPFGGGPRNCIGTGFAMMEAMLVLAGVLQRYSLELPLSPPPPPSRQAAQPTAAAAASDFPAPFPKPKPLLTLRPESVVLRITPR